MGKRRTNKRNGSQSPDQAATVTRWIVFRQDDNGKMFEVRRGLSETQTRELVTELESHGYKQHYWATREESPD